MIGFQEDWDAFFGGGCATSFSGAMYGYDVSLLVSGAGSLLEQKGELKNWPDFFRIKCRHYLHGIFKTYDVIDVHFCNQ